MIPWWLGAFFLLAGLLVGVVLWLACFERDNDPPATANERRQRIHRARYWRRRLRKDDRP